MIEEADPGYAVTIEKFGPEGARPVLTGRRDIPTSMVVTKFGKQVICEHNVERDFVRIIDFDRRIKGIRHQPHRLSFVYAGERIRYTPDFALETAHGDIIVEVKTRAEFQAKEKVRTRMAQVREVYQSVAIPFHIAFDDIIRVEPRFSNINEIMRYRTVAVASEDRARVLAHLSERGSDCFRNCAALIRSGQHGPSAIRALAARHDIALDISLPISEETLCLPGSTTWEANQ
ncbi:TnsA endonuclease N-terminal domain-containing protein [uncultured Parvibaculum sp.]|uniref:TnsA endonuclease N-terminal domain-containing protein n=1 Tax=uncultured Parvibaculum sp. TaxID=291828 RepID=UPI0030D76664|tara:strand:+ start:24067 stop:24762 length:696 start_codon:yes stop_codon:yes gene_type:complete